MGSKQKTNKQKDSQFPVTPLAFYIKLYCKKKGSSESKYQSNLIEATKSWLSLTEEEKQQVHETYKEQEHKYKQQFFDQLKNAEAFMKVKDPVGLKNVELNTTSSSIKELQDPPAQELPMIDVMLQSQTETLQAHQIENDAVINLNSDQELETDIVLQHEQGEDYETIEEPIQSTDEETPKTLMVEPLPPTLKSGKDLFYMLNPAGGAESVSWTELQTSEKNQYRRAVTLLKSDYIIKYKAYLENLTSRELYDYYNKTLN